MLYNQKENCIRFPKAINTYMTIAHFRFSELAVLYFMRRSALLKAKLIMVFPGHIISCV